MAGFTRNQDEVKIEAYGHQATFSVIKSRVGFSWVIVSSSFDGARFREEFSKVGDAINVWIRLARSPNNRRN